MPSRFIDELPAANVDVLTPPGLYGGGYGAAAHVSTLEDRVRKADVYNSPGWRRLQEKTSRPLGQPSEAASLVIDAVANSPYALGDRVFHQKFGYGAVMAVEGDKLDIEFDLAGAKKIVARWVIPAQQVDDVPF
jgi:DNA helicase-2/ATP-dependent DNA helicase PcrA